MKTTLKTTILVAIISATNICTASAHHHTHFETETAHILSHIAIGLVVLALAAGAYYLYTHKEEVRKFFR